MQNLYRVKPFWRVWFNFAVITLCRYLPSLRLKNVLYRMIGMKVGRGVSVGLMAMFDIFFPELIKMQDNCVIGYNATVLTHEFLVDQWRRGPVEIGPNAMVGTNVTILPGVLIGAGSVIGACSLVNKTVPPDVTAGGVPVRIIARRQRKSMEGTP